MLTKFTDKFKADLYFCLQYVLCFDFVVVEINQDYNPIWKGKFEIYIILGEKKCKFLTGLTCLCLQ